MPQAFKNSGTGTLPFRDNANASALANADVMRAMVSLPREVSLTGSEEDDRAGDDGDDDAPTAGEEEVEEASVLAPISFFK